MSLRPLLEIAHSDERFGALAAAAREGAEPGAAGGRCAGLGSIRPYAIAALLEASDGLEGAPALVVAPDDIAARDLRESSPRTWRRGACASTLARHGV